MCVVNISMYTVKSKRLWSVIVALLLAVSLVGAGQLASAAGTEGSENSSDQLANGNYYMDYTVLYAGEDKTSMSAQYLVSPALLKVADNKKTISFTVLQSKEIVGIKLGGKEGTVVSTDVDNNSRVVMFEIDKLSDIHSGWISINWVIESIDFKYIHEYDIRFKFLTDSITAVADDAPVPTKDGKVGFPSGLNEDSEQSGSDNETGEPEVEEPQTTGKSFKDTEGHWAKAVIDKAVQLGIADGYSDGTFKPNAVITRSQFSVMLSRALKLPASSAASSFVDQAAIPAWATEHINAAVAAGLMDGYSDGTFKGDNNISRTEMAVIIARAAQLEVTNGASVNFADAANIPAWAQKEVAAAVEAGLIGSKGNNRFEPAASATRAEALTIIVRLLEASAL